MRPIESILSEALPDLPQDVADKIVAAVRENYVTVAERDEKVRRAETYKAQVDELAAKVEQLEASDETQALRAKLAEFEAAEAKRLEDERAAEARRAYEDEFDKALAGREFVNARTRDSVLAEAIAKREANPDMGMDAVLEGITKDADGLFANPQTQAGKQPAKPRATASKDDGAVDMADAYRDIAARLFGPTDH